MLFSLTADAKKLGVCVVSIYIIDKDKNIII